MNQAIKAKRKLEAVREKQKEVDTINCWRKDYQLMFLLYHQRKEGQSKCELSFYTSQQVLCLSSVIKGLNFVVLAVICQINAEVMNIMKRQLCF